MMDFSKLTDEELKEIRSTLNAEIGRREEIERQNVKTELKCLLERVNELQDEYDFEISCKDDDCDWIPSASNFVLL
jgi:hypothetical protein